MVHQYESCNNQTNDALDAYQRAADLDPSNVHIKARLQLLRNGGQPGMPNQHSAPIPQDIHPQLYQAPSVAGPPGVQWGVGPQAPAPAPLGQAPGPHGPPSDWRLAAIENPQPQGPNPYEIRDGNRIDAIRPDPQPRRQSPRQEHIRQYQEPHRHTPVRRPSPPPPNMNHMAPPYPSQQGLPPPGPPSTQQGAPTRITNPNYGAANAGIPPPPPLPAQNGNHGGPGPMPPIGRGNSPPPEIRPIADDRMSSPTAGYPHQPYQHHANSSQPAGIAAGAPPPTAALQAAENAAARQAAAREIDERPNFKRLMDSDEDYKSSNKKPANGDSRGRLDDQFYRRNSPPERLASPRDRPRRSSSETRREEQHRANANYHPSDAAHHPQTLPAMQQHAEAEQAHLPPMAEAPRDERREPYEGAARKVDMDEDYNDEPEDEKRGGGSGGRNSPQRGLMTGQTKVEPAS